MEEIAIGGLGLRAGGVGRAGAGAHGRRACRAAVRAEGRAEVGRGARGGVPSTSTSVSRRSAVLGVPLGLGLGVVGAGAGVVWEGAAFAAEIELTAEEKRALRVENAGKVKEGIRVFGGWAFTLGTAVYAVKVWKRRAQRAKELRLRSDGVTDLTLGLPRDGYFGIVDTDGGADADSKAAQGPEREPTAFEAFQGAAIAFGCAFLLYQFTAGVEESVTARPITAYDSDRAARISVIVRTLVVGGFYLITFIFGANSVGLFLLGCQKALGLGPDKDADADESAGAGAAGGAPAPAPPSAADDDMKSS